MKKLLFSALALILILVCVFSLSACSKKTDGDKNTQQATDQSAEKPTEGKKRLKILPKTPPKILPKTLLKTLPKILRNVSTTTVSGL